MKFRHQIETPDLEEVKERIMENRLTPIIAVAATTFFAVMLSNRKTQINITITTTTD